MVYSFRNLDNILKKWTYITAYYHLDTDFLKIFYDLTLGQFSANLNFYK